MYTKEEKDKALKLYEEVHSVTKVIKKSGYPTSLCLEKALRQKRSCRIYEIYREKKLKTLKNREKATIIDVLKNEYSLPELLKITAMAKSNCYYLKKSQANKYF